MKSRSVFIAVLGLATAVWTTTAIGERSGNTGGGNALTVTPGSLSFSTTVGGAAPPQLLAVSANKPTGFTASVSVQSGGTNWLAISPSGALTTNQNISVSVNSSGLAAGTYQGTISLTASRTSQAVPVTLAVSGSSTGGGSDGLKLVGWNDLGMHCFDGKD